MKQENLITEIERIQNLMGLKVILEIGEVGLLAKLATKEASMELSSTLSKLKSTGVWKETDIDNIIRKLDISATADEIADLKMTMRNYLESTAQSADSGYYKYLEDVYKGVEVPAYRVIKSISELSSEQVKQLKSYWHGLFIAATRTGDLANSFKTYIDGYVGMIKYNLKRGKKVPSREDFFIDMERRLNDDLMKNVNSGAITIEYAEGVFNKFKEDFRSSPEIDQAMKEAENAGLTSTKTRGKPVKFGDTAGEVNNEFDPDLLPPTYSRDLPDGTTETLDGETAKTYDNMSSKSNNDLSPAEKEFKDSVDKWKNGEDVDIDLAKKKYDNRPPKDVDYENMNKKILEKEKTGTRLSEEEINFKNSYKNYKETGEKPPSWETLYDEVAMVLNDIIYDVFGKNFKVIAYKFDQIGKVPRAFATFYEGYLRPYFRRYIDMYDIIKKYFKNRKIDPKYVYNRYMDAFTVSMEEGFSRFQYVGNNIIKGSPKDKTYWTKELRNIQRKLTELNSAYKPKIGEGYVRSVELVEMWEAFKQNARNSMSNPAEIDNFDVFCKIIEADKGSFFNTSLEEMFGGLPALKNSSDQSTLKIPREGGESLKYLKTEENFKLIQQTLKTKFKQFFQNIASLILSGKWKTPKEIGIEYAQRGYVMFRKGTLKELGMGGVLGNFLKGVIIMSVLATFIYNLVDVMINGWQKKTQNLKNDDIEKYGSGTDYIIDKLIYEPLLSIITGTDLIETIFNDWFNGEYGTVYGFSDGVLDTGVQAVFLLCQGAKENIEAAMEEGGLEAEEKAINTGTEKINVGLTEKTKQELKVLKSSLYEDIVLTRAKEIFGTDVTSYKIFKSRLKYINQVPKDFLPIYYTRLKELEATEGQNFKDGELLNTVSYLLDPNFASKLTTDPEKLESIKKTLEGNVEKFKAPGSLVLEGESGDNYLVVLAATDYPLITLEEKKLIVSELGEEVGWVKPKFDDIKYNTEREYFSIKDFVNNYKNL